MFLVDIYKVFWKEMVLLAALSIEISFLYVYSDQQAKIFIDELNNENINFKAANFHIIASILLAFVAAYLKSVNIFFKGKVLARIRAGLVTLILEK